MSRLRYNLIGFNTIVMREMKRVLRIWVQTLVPPVITATLYFIIFGRLIGNRVGAMGGYSYIDYIAPGLIMMQVITSAYANVVSSFFGAKFGRHIEELMVSPLPNSYIIMGYVTGGVLRGLLVGLLVMIVALFFTDMHLANPLITLAVVLLTSVVFALGGLINAVYAKKFDDVTIIPTFVLTPLTYLGGVFYSINMLPEGLKAVSRFNPILYMVNAFRHGFLGTSDVDPGFAFMIMGAFAVAMYLVVVALMNRGTGIRE